MKRRGVLGFLGGAAVAGPSMAKQAIASGLEGLNVGGVGMLEKGFSIGGLGYASKANGPVDENYDPLEWPKRELADFLGRDSADGWSANCRTQSSVSHPNHQTRG